MKICISILLFLTAVTGYSQKPDFVTYPELKLKILVSKEVKEWQDAVIAFQKSNNEFCALKYEQHLNQRISVVCGTILKNADQKDLHLKIFRSMRITAELKEIAEAKELIMRQIHPEIATHFKDSEIFHELYAPIKKAREKTY